jgi:hypothetical protein
MGRSSVNKLGQEGIKSLFFRTLQQKMERLWLPRVAGIESSTQPMETYRFVGDVTAMREWNGKRHKRGLKVHELDVRNKLFENTLELSQDDWEEDKLGQLSKRIADLSARAAVLPQAQLTSAVIVGNATAYDGVALFGDRTAVGTGGGIDNARTAADDAVLNITTPASPTSEEMKAGILALIQAMFGAVDEEGEPVNADASRFEVMVPVNHMAATAAALRVDLTSAGVSNTLQAVAAEGNFSVGMLVNPRLTATDTFYVFRTDLATRAIYWQEREGVRFQGKGEASERAFDERMLEWGSTYKGAAFPGEPAMCCRGTFS